MKKFFVILTALMAIAAFSTASFAANAIQMTLTSPTIYKAGCEKIGSTTYTLDGNSEINAGDWWYMDLPEGITLCKDYNFVIAGIEAQATPNVFIDPRSTTPYTTVGFNGGQVPSMAGTVGDGPLSVSGLNPLVTAASGNMAFLVRGVQNSRRVTLYALTPTGTASRLRVGPQSTLQFKVFDGNAHNVTNAIAADGTRILLDLDNDGIYGEIDYLGTAGTTDEVIGGNASVAATTGTPYVENTLCSNNETLVGQYVYTSYASKSDKFTFSGDTQIAHTSATGAIALKACKGTETFDIVIDSSQSASSCWFHYDNIAVAANGNYCDTDWPALGQRFLIEATAGFGDLNDKYSLTAQITSPSDGVYFSAAPVVTRIKSSEDECEVAGDATTTAWTAYEGSSVATGYAPTTCTVNAGYRVDKIVQTSATVFTLDAYDTVFVDFASFAFANSMIAAGEEVTVQLTLDRYPCGTIFTGSRTIGTFVTSCASSSSTTLRFPWLPGTNAAGWWGGFAITNFGATAGTADLIYRDSAGRTATYTTPAVAANAMWDNSAVTASELTDVDGYDPGLNFSVSASCAFSAKGFAFTGNGTEGVGYSVDN